MTQFENPYSPSTTISPISSRVESGELATLSERFAGAFIDGLIILPIVLPLAFGTGLVIGSALGDSLITSVVASVVGGLIGMGAFAALHGYLLATRGQTIGKIVMKTKIVNEAGNLIPFNELFLKRYVIIMVISMIPFVGFLIGIVNALCVFRGNRKCLHDDFAGTKVIKIVG